MLDIYAGPLAKKTIEQQGFSADLFNTFLGASGGPKWFTLFGLDKYLFGEFFAGRSQALNIVGSSAGAFRAACFCSNAPVAAITDFAEQYCDVVYQSKKPTAQEVTKSAEQLVNSLLGKNNSRVDDIINNPVFKAHFIVSKTRGLVACENKILQGLGLLQSLLSNYQGRQRLSSQYQRFVFQTIGSELKIDDPYRIPTQAVSLTKTNLKDALLASGCIPMVMTGIKEISGSPKGTYRDGGIIDYHFDFKIKNQGLTLYPHFGNTVKAGWFDKNLKRGVQAESYDNVVLICPSEKFVQSLPYSKISDRKDYHTLDDHQRVKYWQTVLSASEQLAQSFDDFCQYQPLNKIKPITMLNT